AMEPGTPARSGPAQDAGDTATAVPASDLAATAAPATVIAGSLVCRVYRQGRSGAAWLVVVDAQELGSPESGQRLFLGRMLRACGLRRSEGGADVPVHEGSAGMTPISLEAASADAPVNAVLLVGSLAARAIAATGSETAPMVACRQQALPAAILPALSDV